MRDFNLCRAEDLNLSFTTEVRNEECWVIVRAGPHPQVEVAKLHPGTLLSLAATVVHNTPGYEHLWGPIVDTIMGSGYTKVGSD